MAESSVTLALGMSKEHCPHKGRSSPTAVEAIRSWPEWEVKSTTGRRNTRQIQGTHADERWKGKILGF